MPIEYRRHFSINPFTSAMTSSDMLPNFFSSVFVTLVFCLTFSLTLSGTADQG